MFFYYQEEKKKARNKQSLVPVSQLPKRREFRPASSYRDYTTEGHLQSAASYDAALQSGSRELPWVLSLKHPAWLGGFALRVSSIKALARTGQTSIYV